MRQSFLLILLLTAPARARAVPDQEGLVGEVVFESGVPLEGVTVYALDRKGEIAAVARSGARGEVALAVKNPRKVVLGAGTPRFEVARIETPAPGHFRAVMRVVPQGIQVLDPAVGALTGEVMLEWGPLKHLITGATYRGGVSACAGYRVLR